MDDRITNLLDILYLLGLLIVGEAVGSYDNNDNWKDVVSARFGGVMVPTGHEGFQPLHD
jgi:hypothetical protein